MTSEVSLRELVAMQSCQNPAEFKGLDAVEGTLQPDQGDPESVILAVYQDPSKLTAAHQMHRLRQSLGVYSLDHPDELALLDAVPPSHFKPAGEEANHAVVRAKLAVAKDLADLFARDRLRVDPTLRQLLAA